jgi:tetratricopeptide (TPR) repeat protein
MKDEGNLHLSREALALWDDGRLEDALATYQRALAASDPDHHDSLSLHGQIAGVLAALGRYPDARAEYEAYLHGAVQQGSTSEAVVARHLLAEHLLTMGDAAGALAVVRATTECEIQLDWLLRVPEARALWQLGSIEEASRAADLAIERAPTPEKAEELREHLRAILHRRP